MFSLDANAFRGSPYPTLSQLEQQGKENASLATPSLEHTPHRRSAHLLPEGTPLSSSKADKSRRQRLHRL
jgi:hypothetical protein